MILGATMRIVLRRCRQIGVGAGASRMPACKCRSTKTFIELVTQKIGIMLSRWYLHCRQMSTKQTERKAFVAALTGHSNKGIN